MLVFTTYGYDFYKHAIFAQASVAFLTTTHTFHEKSGGLYFKKSNTALA